MAGDIHPEPSNPEPFLNVPWPPMAVITAVVLAYVGQSTIGDARTVDALGVSLEALRAGHFGTLISSTFIHSGWGHVISNSVALLPMGVGPARLFGVGPRGGAVFILFFVGCAALAAVGFAAVEPAGGWVLLGASGGVMALAGATARLVARRGRLGPLLSWPVLAFAAGVVVVELTFLALGLDQGVEGRSTAWQAHLFGFAAGVFLVGPAWRLAGGRDPITQ